jgi:hypothetical protein
MKNTLTSMYHNWRKETTRRRWEDNIKMDIRAIVGGGMAWIDPAQDKDQWRALVDTVMKNWVP